MSAEIIPFASFSRAEDRGPMAELDGEAPDMLAEIQAAIDQLAQLDRDLQLKAHKIELAIGEVRRRRRALIRRISGLQSA